uniref:Myeloid leukemia factor 1 n=1 Tax=Nelumbo nucifera TaxID=4432 RepID=A0A822XFM6_NELNU|nr:TPA_asm: hypothetical protein HUJ06_020165 [Nelumbo nucifera]
MQRERARRSDSFDFGDPFVDFGGHRSLASSIFGGRDPFDDPFFTTPFQSMFGPNMLRPNAIPFGNSDMHLVGFLDNRAPQSNKPKGPIITEITSEDKDEEDAKAKGKREKPRMHSSSKEPYVEDPDDEVQVQEKAHSARPQVRSYSFHSSSVTYAGANGAYYTSSTTRRAGTDGVTLEENREADKTTGQATHKISRGLHGKGHSITRKLNSDGKVDTMQTLHNLNEGMPLIIEQH